MEKSMRVFRYVRGQLFSWWYCDTRAIEVLSAYASLVWAASLWNYNSAAGRIYPLMIALAPSQVWIAIMLIIGLGQAIGVCFLMQSVRRVWSMLSWGLWAFIAVAYWEGTDTVVTAGVYALFSLMTLWVAIRGPSDRPRD